MTPQTSLKTTNKRLRIHVSGYVQGVGFRPQVYRLAKQLKLSGFVRNSADGVIIEIQGEVDKFLPLLKKHLPARARIETLNTDIIPIKKNENKYDFRIIESKSGTISTKINPDIGICNDCLTELFDPNSRFYLYPFINCTNCGPRYTITSKLPYDRLQTTMRIFTMCPSCQKDYRNPLNRRFHAEPIACDQCGPQLSHDIKTIASAISKGKIVAVKSLGGYQLICDAYNEAAIDKLRSRKNRYTKPFALMTLNIESLKLIANCDELSNSRLSSWQSPIVLLPKHDNNLPDSIAPRLNQLGVMLPYTPLHYLIFHALIGYPSNNDWLKQVHKIVLIVTSANVNSKPLIADDAEADIELTQIADHTISYNRKIISRIDDSVIRIINRDTCFIRKARGFTPTSIKLAHKIPSIIALGSHLKNTVCLTRNDEAFVSQHIGDLENIETINHFHNTINHLIKILGVQPTCVIHDLHPDFYTTQFAHTLDIPIISIQHHHAHLASVAAEYHINEPVLGLALDGYGYGIDGTAWGGELLLLDGHQYKRIGHLKQIKHAGGDITAKQPWRTATSILLTLNRIKDIKERFPNENTDAIIDILQKMQCTLSSSCGRLFDAASAILGVQTYNQYEGHAAMQLESLVSAPKIVDHGWTINEHQLSFLPLFEFLLNCDKQTGANYFHGTLAAGFTEFVEHFANQFSIKKLLLSGGCFCNKIFTEQLIQLLNEKGIKAYLPRQTPPNDGGLSLGQAWLGGLRVCQPPQTTPVTPAKAGAE